jgi:uncharacterized repeat protein (TIGR03803 family)
MNTRLTMLMTLVATLFLFALSSPAFASDKQVLYTFQGGSDGAYPSGQLIFDGSGNAYGTTVRGGDQSCQLLGYAGCGTVFELIPGSNGWSHVVLYSFVAGSDGALPEAGLVIDNQGNLYGTTQYGGTMNHDCSDGCGTVFELTPGINGWTETIIQRFAFHREGAQLYAPVTLGSAGQLYGDASIGGIQNRGTVFELTPQPNGSWTEYTIDAFGSWDDGSYPEAPVTLNESGTLYGTAAGDGLWGCGTVFKLSQEPDGGWTKANLHEFTGGADGCDPNSGLTLLNGDFFGTTETGGPYGVGVAYKLKPSAGEWGTQIIHRFTGQNDGSRPSNPNLAVDPSGNLYGTTYFGGYYQYGTVFELVREEGGKWSEKVWHNFKGGDDGLEPTGVVYYHGNLYGAINSATGYGAIYEITLPK